MENEKNVSGKTKKKMNSGIRFFLSVVVIFILGYVILNYVPFISKYDHYVIQTGSMEPVIMTDDIVIIDTSTSIDELETGDIIAFYLDIDGTQVVFVHYLYSITVVDNVRTFKTKPEVSGPTETDPWDLVDEDIIGTHVLTISKIGPLLLFAQSTIGRIVLVVDVVVIYLLVELLPKKKEKEKNSDDDLPKEEPSEHKQ